MDDDAINAVHAMMVDMREEVPSPTEWVAIGPSAEDAHIETIVDRLAKIGQTDVKICKHASSVNVNGFVTCIDCGTQLNTGVVFEEEWQMFYGANASSSSGAEKSGVARSNKSGMNGSVNQRCHYRRVETKNIYKELENLGFTQCIIDMANVLYQQVTDGKIYRGNSRKSIIFSVVFAAYKLCGIPQNCDELIKIFNVNRRVGLKGLKHIYLNIPKSHQVDNVCITPIHVIENILRKLECDDEQIKEVQEIYTSLKNKISFLNRCRPVSSAAGIIYYYILARNKPIALYKFSQTIGLSDLTIKKIARSIDDELGTNYVTKSVSRKKCLNAPNNETMSKDVVS